MARRLVSPSIITTITGLVPSEALLQVSNVYIASSKQRAAQLRYTNGISLLHTTLPTNPLSQCRQHQQQQRKPRSSNPIFSIQHPSLRLSPSKNFKTSSSRVSNHTPKSSFCTGISSSFEPWTQISSKRTSPKNAEMANVRGEKCFGLCTCIHNPGRRIGVS